MRIVNEDAAGTDQGARVAHVFARMHPRFAFARDDPFAPADMAFDGEGDGGAGEDGIRRYVPFFLRYRTGFLGDLLDVITQLRPSLQVPRIHDANRQATFPSRRGRRWLRR